MSPSDPSTDFASTPEIRAHIAQKSDKLILALESHPLWSAGSRPNHALYHVWDFVNRSKYMLSEYDNVREGRPLKYPDQFRPAPGKGLKAAEEIYRDVVGRNTLIRIMVHDKSGKTAMMLGTSIDFGADVKAKARALDSEDDGEEEYRDEDDNVVNDVDNDDEWEDI